MIIHSPTEKVASVGVSQYSIVFIARQELRYRTDVTIF